MSESKVSDPENYKTEGIVQTASIEEKTNSVFGQEKGLSRGLRQRHIQIFALVGIFGTGLFLSSGSTLVLVGNVGMLIAYLFVGIIVLFSQMANAEVSTLMPVTGYYIRHSEHFIDDALGFALGWISVYQHLIPSELAATAVVMTYWSDLNSAVWITVFSAVIIITNAYSIRFYGEVEFVMGIAKICLIFGLIITGLVIDLGGAPNRERLGFRYWKESPWNEYYTVGSLGRFLAFWKCVSGVVYAYGGVQMTSLLAGEVKYPRRSLFTAAKRIVIRVIVLYMVTVFILTLIAPSSDKSLANTTGNATGSPFVVAIKRAKILVLPHIVNALVLSSAFSAANLSLVSSSRTLFALASKRQAPQLFLKTNKLGIPYWGIIFSAAFLPLAYMSSSAASANVFSWFQSITSSNLLISWIAIALNHIALQKAMKAQGFSRSQLPYTFRLAPFGAYFSLFFSILILLTAGFPNFLNNNFQISSFFSAYFTIPLATALYVFWKFFKKTKLKAPKDVDLESLFDDVSANPEPPLTPVKGWKIITLLWY